jgi:lipopolysaccharide transport system permease protein
VEKNKLITNILQTFNDLFKYRDLWYMLTFRDIRIRYKQAAMGFLWAIFMPIVGVAAGILIKKAMAVVSGRSVDMLGIVSISVKVLPWTFFISAIRFSVQSLVGNSDLITKIYFPRAILPLASITACLFDLSISIVVLTFILICVNLGVSIYLLWAPVILFFLLLFTIGVGLLLSSANLFFRDVKYVVEIILMFGIFFTPVFYDAKTFGNWKTLLLLNPMGSILESLNQAIVLKQMPDPFWLGYAGVCSIAFFYIGILIFQQKEQYFAENI